MAAHNATQRIRTAATNEAVFSHTAWLSLAIVSGGERQFLPDALPYTFPCRALAFPYDSASTGSPPPSPETRPGLPKRGKDGYSGIPHPQTKSVDKANCLRSPALAGSDLQFLGISHGMKLRWVNVLHQPNLCDSPCTSVLNFVRKTAKSSNIGMMLYCSAFSHR